MNFEEAARHSLTVPWKAVECFSGPQCWCRMVVPVEPIECEYNTHDGLIQKDTYEEIIGPAAINKTTAEYIVKIHNENLEFLERKKKLSECSKERLDALEELSNLDQEIEIHTNEWNYRIFKTTKNHKYLHEPKDVYEIREVFYDENNEISNIALEPILVHDSASEIKKEIKKMLNSCNKPAIDYSKGEEV